MDELLFILSLSNNSIFNHNPFSVRKIYWSCILPGSIEEIPLGAALTAIEIGSKIAVPKPAAASIKISKYDSSSPVPIQNPNYPAAKAQAPQNSLQIKNDCRVQSCPCYYPHRQTCRQACCKSSLRLNQSQNLQQPERSQPKAKRW